MSRSNPNDNGAPNPSVRWFEWNGEDGLVRYYDKEAKKTVDVGSDFKFMLLDQLGSVGGWHEDSQSAIYSNQVKDTRREPMIVKAFKGGTLAEGIYQNIRDRVKALGGQFVANCYIAFKHNGELAIGSLRFKGAALGAWMDFTKDHRADLYKKAVAISGYTEGKKGRVIFRVPTLKVVDLTPESNNQAVGLDAELQAWLKGYFARTTKDQVERAPQHEPEIQNEVDGEQVPPITDDDIPF